MKVIMIQNANVALTVLISQLAMSMNSRKREFLIHSPFGAKKS